jgi:hypothetical protein
LILPNTRTLASGIFPDAVIWPAKNRPKSLAASITAFYPAIFACDENISYDCALESIIGTFLYIRIKTPITIKMIIYL